jgi:polar amino acid transport system substrate-binding protein
MRRPLDRVPPLSTFAALLALAALLAGCAATSDQAVRTTLGALETPAAQPPAAAPTPPTPPCGDVTASLRPPAALPAPGRMPAGSFMATIQKRGYLIAGVNAGALDFGYLNPFTGQIDGFEVDLVRQLARAIFGNPDRVRLLVLAVPQRIPFAQQGKVDVVVDTVTITCARRRQVDFSTVYYDAKQRVLVPANSPARSIADLGGKRVCASAQSAPIQVIHAQPSRPIAVGAPQAIDCLVYLQEGRVDAISTDDSILLGLRAQDPNTKLIGGPLADVPYGMVISQAHPDFVRFVNGVLEQLRTNGTWTQLYRRWLGKFGPVPAPPQPHYDG